MKKYDVAIIGGGLAGSTVAASLIRMVPSAKVLVIERERYQSWIPGCEVCEGANVVIVRTIEDRVDSLRIEGTMPLDADEDGWVSADHFVDASGSAGVLGRFMAGQASGLACSPRKLAIWGIWRIPCWPESWPRCAMKSAGGGCLWLIPISESLVSVGFVAPATLTEDAGLTRAELYASAISDDSQIEKLIAVSQLEGQIRCSSGSAYMPGRTIGDNWSLVGECAGFTDPVQAVGMSLAEVGADEVATVIAAGLRGEPNSATLRQELSDSQNQRLAELVKLEKSWYAATGRLGPYLRPLAKIRGLNARV